MMRIRPLAEAHLSLIRTWMRDAPMTPAWSDDDLAAIVKAPSCNQRRVRSGWIAEDENRSAIAGFAVATALCVPDTPAECELEFVFVAPEARGQGIGRMLIRTICAWARDLGADEMRLEVRASNTHALRLYERCGFLIEGRRPGYYADPREDAVLMRCRIEPGREDAPV
jgi:[ribosomal protein S18]-alanine N-acetyltransferase